MRKIIIGVMGRGDGATEKDKRNAFSKAMNGYLLDTEVFLFEF